MQFFPVNLETDRNSAVAKIADRLAPKRGARVQQCFLNTDLRYSAPGLIHLCDENGIDVSKRKHGELIVFINTARDHIKVLACNESTQPVVASYRLPKGRIYDLRVVSEITKAFRADGTINFNKAMKNVLDKLLEKK